MLTEFAAAIAVTDQKRASALFFVCRGPLPSVIMFRRCLGRSCLARAWKADVLIGPEFHKSTWAQVGRVAEPGRYLFTFGWLTVTDADLAVWQQYPDAAFTLVVQFPLEAVEEYRLGAFAL